MNNTDTGYENSHKKHGRKKLSYILLVFLLAGVSALGVWYWQNNKVKDLQSQVDGLRQQQSLQSGETSTSGISNAPSVKGYSDKFVSFSYPSEWKVTDETKNSRYKLSLNIESPDISINRTDELCSNFANKGGAFNIIAEEGLPKTAKQIADSAEDPGSLVIFAGLTKLDGKDAVLMQSSPGECGYTINYQIPVNDSVYTLQYFGVKDADSYYRYLGDFYKLAKSFKIK